MRVNQPNSSPIQNSDVSSAKSAGRASSARGEKAERGESKEINSDSKTEISARGKEFARAKEVASSAPDVREEKIAELKRRIASGKYNVDSTAVADRLVDEHLKTADMG